MKHTILAALSASTLIWGCSSGSGSAPGTGAFGGMAGSAGGGAASGGVGGTGGVPPTGGAGGTAGLGGAGGAPGCVVPSPGQLDGDYLLAMSAKPKPASPFLFRMSLVTQASGGNLQMQWTLQPLDRVDRKTPVGAPIAFPPSVVGNDGLIDVDLPPIDVPGQANPISGTDITADVASMRGAFCDASGFHCGDLDGALTKPIPLSIDGSTWTIQKFQDPTATPSPVIDCQKTPAGPPPAP